MAADLRPAAVLAELMVPNWFECGVPGRTATSRLIATAFSLVRSISKVREHMQCSESDFLDYCSARKAPSKGELKRLVELISHKQSKMIAKARESLLEIRAKLEGTPLGAPVRFLATAS